MGVTVNGESRIANEIKKNEALEYAEPKTVSELRRFLGLTGWFRQFIRDYAGRTLRLTESLKGKNRQFVWTNEMNAEFEGIKETSRGLRKLALPDYGKKFMLRTDTCGSGMDAVLLQQDKKVERVLVQWASKKFTLVEQRYGITEVETLAVYWGMKKFEYDLRGR